MIRVKIVQNDITTVAKIILIDQKNRVLFLKRSDYVTKYSGEWDLPGGHLKANESLISGLEREVMEEIGVEIQDPVLFHEIDNLNFFYAMYNSQKIELSHEHVEYSFFEKKDLDLNEKFQKVAHMSLELREKTNG